MGMAPSSERGNSANPANSDQGLHTGRLRLHLQAHPRGQAVRLMPRVMVETALIYIRLAPRSRPRSRCAPLAQQRYRLKRAPTPPCLGELERRAPFAVARGWVGARLEQQPHAFGALFSSCEM